MLSDEDRQTLRTLAEKIRELFPEAEIRAYGSRVRGDATWESDFDVCVILSKYDETIRSQISHLAWEVGSERDVVITTLVYSKWEFGEGPCSVTPLVKTILEHGVPA